MNDLVEFLRARLDETERQLYQRGTTFTSEDPERVLDRVAHRRIALLEHRACGATCFELRAFSLRYADHPDYREEWKL